MATNEAIEPALAREMQRRMLRVRLFEDEARRLKAKELVPGPVH